MDKILVIDDSAVQTEFLRTILKEEYEVTAFQTAREGLEAAKTGDFSLILLDVVMPEMDGFTLLKKLQEEIITQNVPVIQALQPGDHQGPGEYPRAALPVSEGVPAAGPGRSAHRHSQPAAL